ncbi:DNA polymerase III subunit chi [Plastorhodobacter daqingensis]|uniref:DNA polymerase III subunit chi n=1 Tax=Plastorhodobacter daqingensis TaxID=1387281 RepID=A0ABW2UNG4_9RHOB
MPALFYHLTHSPVETVAQMLLEKALQTGWRVVIRGSDADRLAWLDQRLWLGADDSFLPHGLAGGPHDADQPVLLTTGSDRPNGAQCLMALDGAVIEADEARTLERAWLLFDGNDPAAVEAARDQWRRLTGAGIAAQYWSEETGRWQKKAEKA